MNSWQFWAVIGALEGKTLKTLDRLQPFDVVAVDSAKIIVRPHKSGKERPIKREVVEGAWSDLMRRRELTRNDIRERYSQFNPAYVAAILAAVPDVDYRIRPIRLNIRS
ncbi:MAG: hypothetical protein KDE09_11585 [Anaerolineales bacterium]|nr:hypothetical protein [Anaerolineales bacterium]MCB0026748.1 hypothetical protein [Anaerolineales bacterium]